MVWASDCYIYIWHLLNYFLLKGNLCNARSQPVDLQILDEASISEFTSIGYEICECMDSPKAIAFGSKLSCGVLLHRPGFIELCEWPTACQCSVIFSSCRSP